MAPATPASGPAITAIRSVYQPISDANAFHPDRLHTSRDSRDPGQLRLPSKTLADFVHDLLANAGQIDA